jgi:phosphotransferase system enzyme I (PtsI)
MPVAVCGEMAGDLQLTRLLLGLGLRNFSMHPAHLLTVKQRVLTSDAAAAKAIVDRIRRADSADRIATLVDKLNAL